jgi:6-phosphogluconolactonase
MTHAPGPGAEPAFHAFDDALSLAHGLADEIAGRLGAALHHRGVATFVATGGTTPGPLYDRLSHAKLEWDKVFVTVSDERWAPPTSPESNEGLIRARLIRGQAERARFVPLKTDAPTPQAAEPKVQWALAALPRPFDVVLLGMGADGHIASLFPGAQGLEQAMDLTDPALVRAVRPAKAAGSTERLSLTLRALLDARFIALMFRGADKREAYRRALGPGETNALPVRGVLRQTDVPVGVYWAP